MIDLELQICPAVCNHHAQADSKDREDGCKPPPRFRPFILAALLVTVSTLRLVAQTEPESWSIRVAALEIADVQDTLWLRTGPGKKPVQVSLNTRIFSEPIHYKGPATLVFYQNEAGATAKEPPSPLATTVLKDKSSLVVFSPRPDNKTYQVFTISDGDFPFGSFRLVNFSSATVRAEFSGRPTLLKPGAAETVVFRSEQNATPVRILALADGKSPRVVRQTSWSIIPTQRELVLFFPNPDSGLIRLRHFVDTKAEDTPAPSPMGAVLAD